MATSQQLIVRDAAGNILARVEPLTVASTDTTYVPLEGELIYLGQGTTPETYELRRGDGSTVHGVALRADIITGTATNLADVVPLAGQMWFATDSGEVGVGDGTNTIGTGFTNVLKTIGVTSNTTDATKEYTISTLASSGDVGGSVSITGGEGTSSGGAEIDIDGGDNATGGNITIMAGGGGETDGMVVIGIDSSTCVTITSSGIGFFSAPPANQPSITGALSSVTDANAKAVLTAIIAALTATNYALDSTT